MEERRNEVGSRKERNRKRGVWEERNEGKKEGGRSVSRIQKIDSRKLRKCEETMRK